MSERLRAVRERFDGASGYDEVATLQRRVAADLVARISPEILPQRPRVLELGCGTGLFSEMLHARLAPSLHLLTDVAPAMLERSRAKLGEAPGRHHLAMDAERPAIAPDVDLVCGNLVAQWFEQRAATLAKLAALLRPRGVLALSTLAAGTFVQWRDAHRVEGLRDPVADYPDITTLQEEWPADGRGSWEIETELVAHAGALDFARGLKRLGAHLARDGSDALSPGALRRVMRRFEESSAGQVSYQVAYGIFRRLP